MLGESGKRNIAHKLLKIGNCLNRAYKETQENPN